MDGRFDSIAGEFWRVADVEEELTGPSTSKGVVSQARKSLHESRSRSFDCARIGIVKETVCEKLDSCRDEF